jgi:hypothetical protein
MKTPWKTILKTPLTKIKSFSKVYFRNSLENHPKHHMVPLSVL